MKPKKLTVQRAAGAVLFYRQGRQVLYLLLQYSIPGHWTFPRGGVEVGEGSIETARREIKEETGISKIRFLPGYRQTIRFRYQWPPRTENAELRLKFITFYLGQVFSRAVRLSIEHKAYEWVSYEKGLKLLKHRNTRELLEKARTRILQS